MKIFPIGIVKKENGPIRIELLSKYQKGLLGLKGFSHIVVCYWMHNNDNEESRTTLRVHPKANVNNPITGVFATRSPRRPNLLAISTCELISIKESIIVVQNVDAMNDSPVLDIKGYFEENFTKILVPEWATQKK